MNYERVRVLVNSAIDFVDHRLEVDTTGVPDGDSWCQLDNIAFDQTFCDEDDDHDDTLVAVRFRWADPNTADSPSGYDDEVTFVEEDMVSAYFLAGQIYAKILQREKLF